MHTPGDWFSLAASAVKLEWNDFTSGARRADDRRTGWPGIQSEWICRTEPRRVVKKPYR